jgi:hypothetical protein
MYNARVNVAVVVLYIFMFASLFKDTAKPGLFPAARATCIIPRGNIQEQSFRVEWGCIVCSPVGRGKALFRAVENCQVSFKLRRAEI